MTTPVILTCAVTGNQTRPEQNPSLPVTPQQIADDCLAAAEAGAAICHVHVRHPEDGRPSMEVGHYREVTERVRAGNPDLILNLTTGPGGRFQPGEDDPRVAGPRTTLLRPERRVEHVAALKPEVCTLDLNTMFFGHDVVMNTPSSVSTMAGIIREAGTKPELEFFDGGDIHMALDLHAKGVLDAPFMCSLVLGVRFGFLATGPTMMYAASLLPADTVWTGFGIGRNAFPMLAQAVILGGHCRIGLEDTVYIEKGVLAPSNRALVEKARMIIEALGRPLATPAQAREILGLG